MQVGSDLYIYHEKQDAGLCAVHCLNSLLQGRYFSEIDLMEIGREFDEQERQVMLESGVDGKDFLKFMAEESGNLADDGNYSIQVIAKALEVWGIETFPITNPEMVESKKNPLKESAFICNLASHWLTVRKFGDIWYNLNSLLSGPEHLSDFYLSAFLDTLMMRGYTVFCVRGNLPKIPVDYAALNEKTWKKVARQTKQNQVQDKDLEDAIAASELEAAIQASLLPPSPKVEAQPQVEDEDQELEDAIRLSQQGVTPVIEPIEEEPPKGANISELIFRMPDGTRLERRFTKTIPVKTVYSFLQSKGVKDKTLISTFPRKEYPSSLQTLEEAGLYPGMTLIIQ